MRTIQTYHTGEHCVRISFNSDKNCRRRSILKKNDDVIIMTSSGHVTSSRLCPMDSPWASLYRPSIVIIPLSGLVSEIFRSEVADRQNDRMIESQTDKPVGDMVRSLV